MAKRKIKFTCQACGYESAKWMGKCPGCGAWNTLTEEMEPSKSSRKLTFTASSNEHAGKPVRLKDIDTVQEPRIKTDITEFNRVLGGGIVRGTCFFAARQKKLHLRDLFSQN